MKALLLLLIASVTVYSCDRPDVLVGDDGFVAGPDRSQTESKLSFALVDATMAIDGKESGARLNLSDDSFTYLFVYVDAVGLFVISAEPFGIAEESGAFSDNLLMVDHPANTIELVSQAPILGGSQRRSAWVEFTAGFRMFDPGTRPANVVIGLVDDRNQIPGFERFSNSQNHGAN